MHTFFKSMCDPIDPIEANEAVQFWNSKISHVACGTPANGFTITTVTTCALGSSYRSGIVIAVAIRDLAIQSNLSLATIDESITRLTCIKFPGISLGSILSCSHQNHKVHLCLPSLGEQYIFYRFPSTALPLSSLLAPVVLAPALAPAVTFSLSRSCCPVPTAVAPAFRLLTGA